MPRYRALKKLLIAHESRIVDENDEFETTFPDGMSLGDALECLDKPAATRTRRAKSNTEEASDKDSAEIIPPDDAASMDASASTSLADEATGG